MGIKKIIKKKVQLIKKEGKSCIEGAKYAAKKYLPPPSKMRGITFHFLKIRVAQYLLRSFLA